MYETMCIPQVTAVLEILQPTYQHVVDLSYLEKGELNFIAWTLPYDDDDNGKADSYCAMNPQVCKDISFNQKVIFEIFDYLHQYIPVVGPRFCLAKIDLRSGMT